MTGNLFAHKSTISITNQAKAIASFFDSFPTQRTLFQATMMKIGENFIRLIMEDNTLWYSHYSLVLSLFASRKSLEAYKPLVQSDLFVMSIKKAVQVLDTIASSTFWMKLGLISKLLRPSTIEIGVLERRGWNLSDVVQIFGRLVTLLTHKNREAAHSFQAVTELLDHLLTRWEWSLNLYYDVGVLSLSHVIDP